ncbi:hypothetical protein NPIL_155511 [Nephila pilipes]|uniref:Uncharacterized protein n=1 Tax=Nephila pilipes TaxID=299642 RepID=A0A8X6UH40_NEPPI|nr:hypothetical protein NPIL_155511 [Nephila pilipes]
MILQRFLTAIIVFLFCMIAIIQTQNTDSNEYDENKENITINGNFSSDIFNSTVSNETDDGFDYRFINTGPYNGTIDMKMNILDANYSFILNFTFNGTTKNPHVDEISFVMKSPKSKETVPFKVNLLLLDPHGKPLHIEHEHTFENRNQENTAQHILNELKWFAKRNSSEDDSNMEGSNIFCLGLPEE